MTQSSTNLTRPPDPWAAVFLAHDTPVSMTPGQIVTVNLRVKNAGARTWLEMGTNAIHTGYKWFDRSGREVRDVDERRTALPGEVAAGGEATWGAVLIAPRTAGWYHLRWDLIASGIGWFADAGNPPLIVPVYVTALPNDVTGWRTESNLNPTEVAYALDGDPRTFWDSRVPQAPGQWFRLNLSTQRVVDGIQFLSPGKGFPAGYVLRVSADGSSWTEAARVPSDNAHDVLAVFSPLPTQYIQIDLIAEQETATNWMISEILIHPTTLWAASASHNGDGAWHAIDNRADTAWESKMAQAPGMWFQIDLGREETVSSLTLGAPEGGEPVGFRVATWQARTSRWQIICEKLNNTAPVDIAFPAVETQFINIQLLQAGDRPWVIHEARIVREMDTWLRPGILPT